jgi:hypothetical protein
VSGRAKEQTMRAIASLRTSFRAFPALTAAALLLAACGGGGGGGGTPPPTDPPVAGTDVPTSATSSSAGAVAFVRSVAASSDNTAAPITVGDATLATSETDEPDPSI